MSTVLEDMSENGSAPVHSPSLRQYFLGVPFDQIKFNDVVRLIDQMRGDSKFRYIVTPNVDHIIQINKHPELKIYYENAWLTLCDSKPVVLLARAMPLIVTRVTGSDLTKNLFNEVIRDGDRITLIAPNENVVAQMRAKYPRLIIRAYVPPFGVSENPVAMQRCVDFVVQERADFVFLAIGAPQSEKIAYLVSHDGRATGICLCIGAALEFMTGMKKRAPRWMSKIGIEWLHRLASDPKRLWRRYLFAVLPLARLAATEIRQSWTARLLRRG